MAMLLVVATTEATDPTRCSDPFRTTANVVSTLSFEDLRRNPWGCRGGSAGRIAEFVSARDHDHQTMEPRVRISRRRR